MPKFDFGAAARRVIADEVSLRLAPLRELLDRLELLVERAEAVKSAAPPSRLKFAAELPLPMAAQPVPAPAKPPGPAREIVVRRLPARPARGSGIRLRRQRTEASAPAPAPMEAKIEAVKPFVRRKAQVEGANGVAEPMFDPIDAKIAKRFSVGQSVRYRAAEGLVTAKVAAIDNVTGILTLMNPKDETRLTIPASNVFAAV